MGKKIASTKQCHPITVQNYQHVNQDQIPVHTYRDSILLTFNQSCIHYIFEKDGLGATLHRIACDDKLRLAINNPLG